MLPGIDRYPIGYTQTSDLFGGKTCFTTGRTGQDLIRQHLVLWRHLVFAVGDHFDDDLPFLVYFPGSQLCLQGNDGQTGSNRRCGWVLRRYGVNIRVVTPYY